MADLTLDINEVQVVVHYPLDADGFFWHHRILLHRIEGGEWLTLTPDLDIVRHDLGAQRHRVLDHHRDAAGKKQLDLRQAATLMKETTDADFPIAGVKAAKEFHASVAASSGGFLTYHSEWLRLSGVSKKASAVHVHRALCESLRLMH